MPHIIYTGPSGLGLTQTRAYSSSLGRFINRDSIGVSQVPNLYRYADNNPVLMTDPEGTQSLTVPATPPIRMGYTRDSMVAMDAASSYSSSKSSKPDPNPSPSPAPEPWGNNPWNDPNGWGNNPWDDPNGWGNNGGWGNDPWDNPNPWGQRAVLCVGWSKSITRDGNPKQYWSMGCWQWEGHDQRLW